jgi:hypothetical protein
MFISYLFYICRLNYSFFYAIVSGSIDPVHRLWSPNKFLSYGVTPWARDRSIPVEDYRAWSKDKPERPKRKSNPWPSVQRSRAALSVTCLGKVQWPVTQTNKQTNNYNADRSKHNAVSVIRICFDAFHHAFMPCNHFLRRPVSNVFIISNYTFVYSEAWCCVTLMPNKIKLRHQVSVLTQNKIYWVILQTNLTDSCILARQVFLLYTTSGSFLNCFAARLW